MKTGIKASLSSAFGATAGALVGIQASPDSWIGFLVCCLIGGTIGYLSYDWKKIAEATPRAWASATSWHPNLTSAYLFFRAWALCTGYCINILFAVISVVAWHLLKLHGWHEIVGNIGGKAIFLFCVSLTTSLLMTLAVGTRGEQSGQNINRFDIPVLFWVKDVPMWFLGNILWAMNHTPSSIRRLGMGIDVLLRFTTRMVCLVHSEMRLLCAVDSTIGASVGYCFGNAVVGGIVGGMVGFLSFEIFSIRALKLVPRSSSIFSR